MKVVIQRVSSACVVCESGPKECIEKGLMILLGIVDSDNEEDIKWLATKISHLRIFPDNKGVMNENIMDAEGNILLVSQFTLLASTKKGNRPSFIKAAKPEISIPLYRKFATQLEKESKRMVKKGVFGDHMDVSLVNDGPVTIIIDSKIRE